MCIRSDEVGRTILDAGEKGDEEEEEPPQRLSESDHGIRRDLTLLDGETGV